MEKFANLVERIDTMADCAVYSSQQTNVTTFDINIRKWTIMKTFKYPETMKWIPPDKNDSKESLSKCEASPKRIPEVGKVVKIDQRLPQFSIDYFAGTKRRYGNETHCKTAVARPIHRWRLAIDLTCPMDGIDVSADCWSYLMIERRRKGIIRLRLRQVLRLTLIPAECWESTQEEKADEDRKTRQIGHVT